MLKWPLCGVSTTLHVAVNALSVVEAGLAAVVLLLLLLLLTLVVWLRALSLAVLHSTSSTSLHHAILRLFHEPQQPANPSLQLKGFRCSGAEIVVNQGVIASVVATVAAVHVVTVEVVGFVVVWQAYLRWLHQAFFLSDQPLLQFGNPARQSKHGVSM